MSATYTRAIVPAVGDPVTSRVVRSVVRAANDRMKLGPCWPWRLIFYFHGAFNQIRNPDASRYLYPAQAEYFTFYQQLSPYAAQYPDAGPGDPEGVNLASQLPGYVFGARGLDVDSEDERLTNGLFTIEAANQKPETLWRLAQSQRGALDPRTGAMGAPALQAANSHAYLRQSALSPHGQAYGDFLAGPEYLGQCDAPNESRPSQTFLFTKLGAVPSTLTFGTCPEISGSAAGVVNTPFQYVIFKFDGTIVVLPKTQWIEGPYTTNPTLHKTPNGFLERAFSQFVSDFRGDAQQRAEGGWNEHAFAFQEILTTQYHLAPQKGVEIGTGLGITAHYPLFRLRPGIGRVAAGTVLPLGRGGIGGSYRVDPAFVCASALVKAVGLTQPVSVALARDGVELAVVELLPEDNGEGDPVGTVAQIVTFDRPAAGGRITATVVGTTAFAGETRELSVELSELYAYKPGLPDLMLILRMGGVSFNPDLDGSGTDCSFATTISEKYLAKGVITSVENHTALPGSLGPINSNAIYDAARRLSQVVRIMPRQNFTGIAVEGGKTILWFSRWAQGSRTDVPIDLFEGLAPAPAPIASGHLVWGRRYKVATAPVLYNRRRYLVGQSFTAIEDVAEFSGSGQVYEADGVYAALPGGWSNQWLMGLSLKPYNPKEASLWKPAAYADYFTLPNRCLIGDPEIPYDKAVLNHLAYGQATYSPDAVLTPEAPDAFNYIPTYSVAYGAGRANRDNCADDDTACLDRRKHFYESCGLFEPWPQPLSIERDGEEIKVTFATFHHDEVNDTADFARDPGTWDLSALRDTETHRTWRNGLREYLVWLTTGRPATVKIGDQAINSHLPDGDDVPYGSVLPTFFWTQLAREPFEDGNEDQDLSDSPLTHDGYAHLGLILRAGCEAFVDGELTAANACAHGTTDLFGFTWESLNYRISQGRGLPVLPTKATDLIAAADTRPDQPEFYGPLPNVLVSAETAAAYAQAFNLLDTFRVMLPATLQARVGIAYGDEYQTTERNALGQPVNGGAAQHLGGLGDFAVYVEGSPAGVGSTSYTSGTPAHDWEDVTDGDSVTLNAQWLIAFQASPLGVRNLSQQMRADFRWLGLGDAIYALPPALRDLLTDSPAVFATLHQENTLVTKSVVTGDRNGTQSHTAGHPDDDVWSLGDPSGAGRAVLWVTSSAGLSDKCIHLRGGSFATGPAPSGFAWDSDDAYGTGTTHRDGPQRDVAITLLNATTPAITVPLVDLPA